VVNAGRRDYLGEAQAHVLYRVLEPCEPQLVLCSTARRSRETLERIEPALGRRGVKVESQLYDAGAGELLARLRRLPDRIESVLVMATTQDCKSWRARSRTPIRLARRQVPHRSAGDIRPACGELAGARQRAAS
jgi:hypothetical protein